MLKVVRYDAIFSLTHEETLDHQCKTGSTLGSDYKTGQLFFKDAI